MRNTFLSFQPPFLDEEEEREVVDTLRSDWITTGPKVARFEKEFAEFVGAPAALAVSSGTDAMQVGLATLGIGPGDEVITTPMTFCSTVHVIEHVGARPVLADVEPRTLTVNPERVARAITSRTKAILPVHLYGHPCNMKEILALAERHRLRVLEDAAHALPTRHEGRMVGALGDMTAFSFYATKNVTTGEGGMLTGAADLIARARLWSLHGMDRDAYKRYSEAGSWYYEVVLPGFKCNMTDIQAALGIHQPGSCRASSGVGTRSSRATSPPSGAWRRWRRRWSCPAPRRRGTCTCSGSGSSGWPSTARGSSKS